jgi:hypothetical protein
MDQPAKLIMASARTAETIGLDISGSLLKLANWRGADRPDPSVLHSNDAVSKTKDAVVVGDDNHRAAGRESRLPQNLEHGLTRFGVERGGRLVADDKARRMNNSARDRDSLLLA